MMRANFEQGSDQFDLPQLRYTPRESDVMSAVLSPYLDREGRQQPTMHILNQQRKELAAERQQELKDIKDLL